MINKSLLLLAALVILFSGCRKNDPLPEPIPASESEEIANNRITVYPAMYMWSGGLRLYSNTTIRDFLYQHKIREAIISVNNDILLQPKAENLVNMLSQRSIRSQILIGNNKLLGNTSLLLSWLEFHSSIKGISGIHLDIEPHILPDWAANKATYISQYIKLVETASSHLREKNLMLSVSIPMHYDTTCLKKVFSLADKVYVMAYETKDVTFIKRRLQEEMAINKGKVTVAIRNKDFASKTEMWNFINQLSVALNTPRFAIHDFDGYRALK